MAIKEKMTAFGCGVVTLIGAAGAVDLGVRALNTQQPSLFVGAAFFTAATLEAFYLLCDITYSHCREK